MAKTAQRVAAKPANKATPAAAPKAATKAPAAPAQRQAVATRPAAQVPATDEATLNLPAFMQADAGLGKENIKQEDLEIPRLKLIQGLSPELTEYNDLRPGNFFHTASETIFDEPFRVVPIFMDRRYMLWRPRDSGGGILARADDGVHWSPPQGEFDVVLDKKDGGHKVKWKLAKTVEQSGLNQWGTMNPADPDSPPAATLMYNFVFAFPDMPELMPAVLTFQRSSIKMGRKFNTKLRSVRTPLFGTMWTLGAVVDSNKANQDFQNINIVGAGLVEYESMYNTYKDLYLGFRDMGLQVKDLETMQSDADANTPGEAPEGQKEY